MASKHTPGPWEERGLKKVTSDPDRELTHIYGEGIIVATATCYLQEEREMVEANARLIAAAPEMADILRDIQGKGHVNYHLIRQALERIDGDS